MIKPTAWRHVCLVNTKGAVTAGGWPGGKPHSWAAYNPTDDTLLSGVLHNINYCPYCGEHLPTVLKEVYAP